MRTNTCSTNACTLEELTPDLRQALRTHGQQYGLEDIEAEVLMCCQTRASEQTSGLFTTRYTNRSAVYVTPKWLVWAVAENGGAARAGSARLRNIDVRDYESTAMFAILPKQGLNVTGRYTDVNQTGITFIYLGAEPDGQRFRHILKETLKTAAP